MVNLSDDLKEKISNRSCDYISEEHIEELLYELDWVVKNKSDVNVGKLRSLYGGGLYTVQDYGRHKDKFPSNEELIEHIKEDAFKHANQYIKFAVDREGTVPDKVVIVRKSNGLIADPHKGELE